MELSMHEAPGGAEQAALGAVIAPFQGGRVALEQAMELAAGGDCQGAKDAVQDGAKAILDANYHAEKLAYSWRGTELAGRMVDFHSIAFRLGHIGCKELWQSLDKGQGAERRESAAESVKESLERAALILWPAPPEGQEQGAAEGEAAADDSTAFGRFARLTLEKRDMENQLAALKAQLELAEEQALNELLELDVKSVRIGGGATVYLASDTWASLAGDKDAAHAALNAAGLGYMVKPGVNSQTLSAWVREQDKEGREIPDSLAGHLSIKRTPRVRVRKG